MEIRLRKNDDGLMYATKIM